MHRSPHQTSEGSAGQGIIPLAVCVSSAAAAGAAASLQEVGQLTMMS